MVRRQTVEERPNSRRAASHEQPSSVYLSLRCQAHDILSVSWRRASSARTPHESNCLASLSSSGTTGRRAQGERRTANGQWVERGGKGSILLLGPLISSRRIHHISVFVILTALLTNKYQ